MTSKSQKVFDEVGYNLSEEVKSLIKSLDFEHGTSTDGSEEAISSLKKDITEYQAEIKRLEKENAELMEKVRSFEIKITYDNDGVEEAEDEGPDDTAE